MRETRQLADQARLLLTPILPKAPGGRGQGLIPVKGEWRGDLITYAGDGGRLRQPRDSPPRLGPMNVSDNPEGPEQPYYRQAGLDICSRVQ